MSEKRFGSVWKRVEWEKEQVLAAAKGRVVDAARALGKTIRHDAVSVSFAMLDADGKMKDALRALDELEARG